MDAVGYRQVKEAVLGKRAGTTIDGEKLLTEITRVTRIFARRQRTWLRDERIEAVPASSLADPAALDELARGLSPA
jgi:tRNA A37 N6-isopentenylltransferase MiaA